MSAPLSASVRPTKKSPGSFATSCSITISAEVESGVAAPGGLAGAAGWAAATGRATGAGWAAGSGVGTAGRETAGTGGAIGAIGGNETCSASGEDDVFTFLGRKGLNILFVTK